MMLDFVNIRRKRLKRYVVFIERHFRFGDFALISSEEYEELVGAENISNIIAIDQTPIGRTPKSNPATYTKAFDQSEGYLLSSQGVFNNKPGTGGIVRSVTGGNPSFHYLNQIVGNLNYATPVSDAFSVYTTADLFIDRSTDEGCKKFYNSAKGVTQERVEMMALLMAEYAAPQFVLNQAAAISPDPKTDPEMGYGAGNAIAAGSSALTSGVARNLGMEALHYNDFKTQVERMNDSTHLPGAISEGSSTFDKVDNYRNNWCNDRTISGEKIAVYPFSCPLRYHTVIFP
jgi:hypothetical protein